MDLLNTLPGSSMEGFFPAGWNLGVIDGLGGLRGEALTKPRPWWNSNFQLVPCETLPDFDTMLGHAICSA